MLQAIRDKTTGWIAYVIIFLISVPFALWGVNSYLGGGEAAPAATVNGVEITAQELDRAYSNYRQQLAQALGGSIPAAFDNETLLKNQVLTQLIEQSALQQYASQRKYRLGDEQLGEQIRNMEVFQIDGQFNTDIYQSQLSSLGYSSAGFEQELRRSQSLEQLQNGIMATSFVVPDQIKQLAELAGQARQIRLLTRKADAQGYEPDADAIKEHYDAQASRYMTAEQARINYIELSLAGIKTGIQLDDAVLMDRYQQTRDVYTGAEFRSASHILLTLEEETSEQVSNQVRDRLAAIKQQIDAGADFAALAKQHSQDPGSAEDGGDLGEIERGMMVPEFESALFALQVGEVSEPVKSAFGWHLIKLLGQRGGGTRSFDEVKVEIADEIKNEMAENQIFDMAENLANLTYEQPDSLVPAAEQLGLKVKTSDWFDRISGTGIAADARVRNLAFSDEVFNQKLNGEGLELEAGRILFLRLLESKPAVQKPLDQVGGEIVRELKQIKGREDGLAAGKEALAAIAAGSDLSAISKRWNLAINDAGLVKRDNSEIDRELLKLAFTMKKPVNGPSIEGHAHANGDYSLVEVSAVVADQATGNTEQAARLNSVLSATEYQMVLKSLTARAEIVKTPLAELQ